MKVLWFSHSPSVGGAEICLVEAVRALREQGWASSVVLPGHGPLRERLEAAGASIRVQRFSWWTDPPEGFVRRVKRSAGHLVRHPRLTALVQDEAPDVVVTNTLAAPGGAFAARAAGVPHVWFLHEFGWLDHGMRFDFGEPASLRVIDRLSVRVVVASQAVFDHFATRIACEKLERVHYSIELPPVLPAPVARPTNGTLELVLIGQKTPGKRQEDAVRAVGILARRRIPVRLTLVGREDPVYAAFLQSLVRDEGVSHLVRLVPFTPDPLSFVAAADVALMCSRLEALGRVTVEAMKLGKPVVGARSGGTAELVQDGVNGLTFPVGDAAALADAVERLHRDRALVTRMGVQAQQWACAKFTRERYGLGLARVLSEAAATRAKGTLAR